MKMDRPGSVGLWETILFNLSLVPMVSISHRVSGMVLFGGVAFALYVLDLAMSSRQGFAQAEALLATPVPKLIMLSLLSLLMFHIFLGIKHLMLDFHIGDTIKASRIGSASVLALTVSSVGVFYLWLW
jgi:succinate dehydrogenase / fumarate reductase cytochrome b subunit